MESTFRPTVRLYALIWRCNNLNETSTKIENTAMNKTGVFTMNIVFSYHKQPQPGGFQPWVLDLSCYLFKTDNSILKSMNCHSFLMEDAILGQIQINAKLTITSDVTKHELLSSDPSFEAISVAMHALLDAALNNVDA